MISNAIVTYTIVILTYTQGASSYIPNIILAIVKNG